MALSSTDIKFYNSGSGSNIGLGGTISPVELQDRLFSDVKEIQADQGLTDYRCLYIKNISDITKIPGETMYKFSIGIIDNNYSDISMGFPGITRAASSPGTPVFSREEQTLLFNYSQGIDGVLEFIYQNKPFSVIWDSQNIINPGHNRYLPCQMIRGLIDIGIVDTSCLQDSTDCCQADGLDITMDYLNCINDPLWNDSGKLKCSLRLRIEYPEGRAYSLLSMPIPDPELIVGTESVFNSGKIELSENIRQKKGGPINATPDPITSFEEIPKYQGSNIVFFDDGESLELGNLKAGEYIPVWIKRIVNTGAEKVADDGFRFEITAYNTPNTTVPPTTLPYFQLVDQKQISWSIKEDVVSGRVYWQYFKAGYSGNLTNVELGFTKNDSGTLSGRADLRIYKGNSNGTSPPQPNDIIYSSGRGGISVSITTNDLNWNNYDLGSSQSLSLEKDKYYIIAYTPRFNHQLLLNNNNCYLCGSHGVDDASKPQLDMVFRTTMFTNMDTDSDNCNSC
jgi:hypothetical protein